MGSARENSAVQKERFFDFGEAIEASGMTQAEIARRVGKTPAYISMLKARRFRPSAKMAIKFHELLGVDVRAFR